MIDLDAFDNQLQELYRECVRRGVPKTISDRLLAVSGALPIIEHARQAQDRSNG